MDHKDFVSTSLQSLRTASTYRDIHPAAVHVRLKKLIQAINSLREFLTNSSPLILYFLPTAERTVHARNRLGAPRKCSGRHRHCSLHSNHTDLRSPFTSPSAGRTPGHEVRCKRRSFGPRSSGHRCRRPQPQTKFLTIICGKLLFRAAIILGVRSALQACASTVRASCPPRRACLPQSVAGSR